MNIQEFKKEIVDIVAELREEFDTADMLDNVYTVADGREEVIYYSRAWDFVQMIRENDWTLFTEAKDMLYTDFINDEDIDTTMTRLASCIWTVALNEYINH